jgi:RimJ/RimL family protein N-acetyltransferase
LLSIADALAETKIADLELTCLLGKRGLASEPIRLAFAQIPGKIRLLESSDKMAELMAEADVMIGAAGSSSWERCCLGVPSLLVTIASNQEGIGRELQRRGMALNLGLTENLSAEDITAALRRLIDSPTSLKAMSVAASDLVDGDGAKRVVKLLSAPSIDLRSVNEGDCQQIFDWSNDPDVRANSFSTAPIPWADHERWFAKRLQDQNCTFYIGTLAKEAAGQVRFEREDQIAIISVSLDSKMRGRGIAAELLRSATQRFLMENTDCQVLAYIRPENIGSIRAFSGAGYLSDGTAMVGDSSCLRYRYPA